MFKSVATALPVPPPLVISDVLLSIMRLKEFYEENI